MDLEKIQAETRLAMKLRELAKARKDSLHAQWLLSQIMIALGNLKDDQAKQCAGHALAHTLED